MFSFFFFLNGKNLVNNCLFDVLFEIMSHHHYIRHNRQPNSYLKEVQDVPQTELGQRTQEPLDQVSVVGMVSRKELAHTRGQQETYLWGKEVLAQFD